MSGFAVFGITGSTTCRFLTPPCHCFWGSGTGLQNYKFSDSKVIHEKALSQRIRLGTRSKLGICMEGFETKRSVFSARKGQMRVHVTPSRVVWPSPVLVQCKAGLVARVVETTQSWPLKKGNQTGGC